MITCMHLVGEGVLSNYNGRDVLFYHYGGLALPLLVNWRLMLIVPTYISYLDEDKLLGWDYISYIDDWPVLEY